MRCGCPHCGTFMVHEDESRSACVCPDCGYRCNACLGTGTVITREQLARLKNTDWFQPSFDGAEDDDVTEPERPDAPREF